MKKLKIFRSKLPPEKARALPYHRDYGPDVEWWHVSTLKPHPFHQEHLPEMTEEELRTLVESIRAKGLSAVLEVLENGLIICGSQRFRAVLHSGWEYVPVIIRHDLANASPEKIKLEILEDNLPRRHLSELQQVSLLETRYELTRDPVLKSTRKRLQDHIAWELGISSKTVRRLLDIATLPIEIQRAYERRLLTQDNAVKLAHSPPALADEAAKRIREGAPSALAVREALAKRERSEPANPHLKLPKKVDKCVRELSSVLVKIASHRNLYQQHWASPLRRLRRQIRDVIDQLESNSSSLGETTRDTRSGRKKLRIVRSRPR